ncbi:MAG: hypothetical protein A2898_04215 [Candidatus Kerfeldbacteria bacterium RIFCSPLOWO2_01_FULL_48_11]|uniref:Glycosyltransferase 2-like domain-containing protein n=1 Tax=Candidatus Kerfeldbacteria bacterium RIFCSPLOWO2_01_FULL_48_11 TaxID=1798543 RepID=A0A1G2B0Q7_9BACT|nr:MAG: Glycosyl transferase [Parcubacteria group bacterium GW2011_GWA2_48_9]KKW16232.1 MAG: Glycosyl transferase [Parcubacteria group bacterium GW2011_GWC2_49_9]OGY82772.1 MAG: hypothetical protein A2898_04215 [Candidatus Kerfeldbacteria bacterium RIFCSPLOWO2_01_FULL_48_11]HCJ52679.1 hypothetical protein [Candidatus Kerfeldbacteria bacterium]HCM67884.1 hypothetical protein [Candidatus Kerfeldbacteria bacterium]
MERKIDTTISIVTWNSSATISKCLESIFLQTNNNYEITVFDNASTDETLKKISSNPAVRCIRSKVNTGYSAAHNEVIRRANGSFILCMNPDVVLTPTFLEKLRNCADSHPEAASFGGKVLRLENLEERPQTAIIDATGLVLLRSFRSINRGEGDVDTLQYSKDEIVFGHSGAVVLLRKSSLDRVKIMGEYLDEDFFAYKEDVDLAWRFQKAGFTSFYVHDAIAYHLRKARRGKRRDIPLGVRQLSYKNHLLMLVKNLTFSDLISKSPWLLAYEFGKFLTLLFSDVRTLFSLQTFMRQLPTAWAKRKAMSRLRTP